ncbi:MAG: hypothetical protein A3G87_05035 [Omnitrophica bacterium RIFCSPLOWO2_12_FULL_50_11]|nr:MAG: hypothetical protein A3G87_05035 [Omnitrophica bacterium RIFCSPLOWO2_12_FULL_50_11]
MVQGELFRDENIATLPNEAKQSFLSRLQLTFSADKILLGTIALMVLFLLTYSLGVERGKRVMEGRFASLLPMHGETLSPMEPRLPQSETTASAIGRDELILVVDETEAEETEVERPAELSVSGVPEIETQASAFPLADPNRKSEFTVQLVTYVGQADAVQEVDRLRSQGHESFVIPSGRYFQVCANYFASRSQAKSDLTGFQGSGRYPDAYVRPVVR